MPLFGNRVFADIGKMMSYRVKVGPNLKTGVLKNKKQDTYRGKMAM